MEFTHEQIQVLLIEKITGTIDPEDDRILERLLVDDADVRRQWVEMNQQVQQSEGFSVNTDEAHRWQEIKPLLKKHRPASRILFTRIVSVAAIVAAIVVGIHLFTKEQPPVRIAEGRPGITLSMDNGKFIQVQDSGTKTVDFGGARIQISENELTYASSAGATQQWSTLAVPATLNYKIRLSDGTDVWLNAETKLRFPFTFPSHLREVYIDGEAYFNVAKKQHQPFVVHTPQTDVVVTGTQFNVNTYNPDNIQTALVEGAVIAKTAGNRQVALKPGFAVSYNAQNGFRTAAFDEADVLSWMKGVYYFHNAPLQELAKVLARWYGVEVRFENAALQKKTFTGELVRQQPLHVFFDHLQLSADVYSFVKGQVVYLK